VSTTPKRIPGSYRDPRGHVFQDGERILRVVHPVASAQYAFIRSLAPEAIAAGFLIDTWELPQADWPKGFDEAAQVLEHKRLPYVSHPYEWSFEALKAAALLHLDFQLWLLDRNAALEDATAYNIQFFGPKPIFIDILSLIPYEQGAYWAGYRQFCEQFLNPLLLRARRGIAHNSWYRGALEGISTEDLAALLSISDKLSLNMQMHVVMHARLQKRARQNPDVAINRAKGGRQLSRQAFKGLLMNLRNWISKLTPKDGGVTVWGEYAEHNSYNSDEARAKAAVVADFVKTNAPRTTMDLGCNSGDYSVVALENGAEYALGFDFDHIAVDRALQRARARALPFLPLWLDAANASPSQGWRQAERAGFAERANTDAVFALAFEHHLAIGKNIPLPEVVAWIVALAPRGLIEFVPKTDPTVQTMLALREDIFPDYSEASFCGALQSVARIVKSTTVSATGRTIYEYAR